MNIEQAAKEYADKEDKLIEGEVGFYREAEKDFTAGANAYKAHISERMKTLREEFFRECTVETHGIIVVNKTAEDIWQWFSNKLNQ